MQNVLDEGKDWPKPSRPVISDIGAGALPSHEGWLVGHGIISGLSPEEVAKHWHMAKSLADVELKLIAEKSAKSKFTLRDK